MNKILVIGSSNTDMVIKTKKLPLPGETIVSGTFLVNPGGKGANQAVEASRLGGSVTFITKRGNDLFGNQSVAASISATRMGAQTSAPYRKEIINPHTFISNRSLSRSYLLKQSAID